MNKRRHKKRSEKNIEKVKKMVLKAIKKQNISGLILSARCHLHCYLNDIMLYSVMKNLLSKPGRPSFKKEILWEIERLKNLYYGGLAKVLKIVIF